jgi:hypothetical protein
MAGNPVSDPTPPKRPRGRPRRESGPTTTFWYLMLLGVLIAVAISLYRGNLRGTELTFGEFTAGISAGKYNTDNVHGLTISPHIITFQNLPLPAAALEKSEKPSAPQADAIEPAADDAESSCRPSGHGRREARTAAVPYPVEGSRDDSRRSPGPVAESRGSPIATRLRRRGGRR